MGDRIPTAAKVILLVLVFGTFLAIYFKPGLSKEQAPSGFNQGKQIASNNQATQKVSGAKFAVTPNPSQALQTAFQAPKPVLLEFYGSG